MVYYHPESNRTVVVPRHQAMRAGTLREILREANLTPDELRNLLSR
jgi:predicted RNA binding protein YcfA (HicA-like mRNA interferase family)